MTIIIVALTLAVCVLAGAVAYLFARLRRLSNAPINLRLSEEVDARIRAVNQFERNRC